MATLTAKGARFSLAIDSRAVLAGSGFVMLAYVVLHMAGNLLAFAGTGTFDGYARALREVGSPFVGREILLWLVRAVLLGAVVAHIAAHAWDLIHPRRRRGGSAYSPIAPEYVVNAFPIPHLTGAAILLFVVFHIAHLTFGATLPVFEPSSPYRNLVNGLRSWPVALGYVAVAAAVGGHLIPGVWSGMRSLGLIRPRSERLAAVLSPTIALLITLGLASVPAAVWLGMLD